MRRSRLTPTFVFALTSAICFTDCTSRTEELPLPKTVSFEVLNYTDVTKIEFLDAWHGMMATSNKVYFTSDGGQTWNFSLQVSNHSVTHICYPTIDTAYVCMSQSTSSGNEVYRTYDHGTTWTNPASFSAYNISPYFISGWKGFVWLDESPDQLYRTLNGSQNWLTLGAQGVRRQMRFYDEYLGYAIDNNNNFTRTIAGGSAWSVEFSGGNVQDYYMLPEVAKVFLTTTAGRIYRSDDNGDNFTEVYYDADGLGVSQVTAHSSGLVVAGSMGWLTISRDFGNTWERFALSGHEDADACYFYTLTAIEPNVVIATGEIANSPYIGKIIIP